MEYTREKVEDIFDELGEVMFVLESDREYELHSGNTEFSDEYMSAEGMRGDEFVSVVIPYDAIEHHFTHRQV